LKFKHLSLYTTEACNLACKYCFLPKHPKDAKKETLTAILEYFYKISAPRVHIHIFGTEPLYRWDLLKHVFLTAERLSRKYGKPTTKGITTNCVALTPARAKWLVKHRVSALCSVDGTKENHNRWRVFPNGEGSYDIVAKNASYWAHLNPNAEAAMTVTPHCIKHLAENVEAVLRLGFNNVALNKMEDRGPQYSSKDLDLFEEKLDDVIELIVDYARRKRRIHVMFLTNDLIHRLRGTDRINPTHTCGAAKGSFAADIHGNFYICHRAIYDDIFKIGNVRDGLDWGKVEWWRSQRHKNCDFCTMPNCSPCYTDSYHRNGDPFIVSWQSCRYNQIIYKKSFDLERRMREAGVLRWWAGGINVFRRPHYSPCEAAGQT